MPSEAPLACSLNTGQLSSRLARMAELARDALLDVYTELTRAQLRFAPAAGVRSRVDSLVAAESECCAFLTMRVSEEPGAVVLTIEAPEDAEALLAGLLDAFRGGRPSASDTTA